MSYGCCLFGHQKVKPSSEPTSIPNIQDEIVERANEGDGEYCFELSKLLIDNESNPKLGEYYLNKSIDAGFSEAYIYYAQILFSGKAIQKDDKKAKKYLNLAVKKNIPIAPSLLAEFYFDTNQPKKGLKILTKSVKNNNTKSMIYLSNLYQDGIIIKRDYNEAVKQLENAYLNGDEEATYQYAEALRKGEICDKNSERSFELHRENISNTDYMYIPSVFSLAEMYRKGEGTEKNLPESARLYKIAADANNKEACCCYSDMLLNGQGVNKNITEGYKYLQKAIDNGSPEAMYKMAMRMINNDSVETRNEAFEYLKKAALLGHVESEFCCGNIYLEKGEYQRAISYYFMASKRSGHKKATLMLGLSYLFDKQEEMNNFLFAKLKESYEIFKIYFSDNLAKIGIQILHQILKNNEKLRKEGEDIIKIKMEEQKINALIPLIKCYSREKILEKLKSYINENEDFYNFRKPFRSKRTDDVFKETKKKIQKNRSPAALYKYGSWLYFGIGCDPNPDEALLCIKEASDEHNSEAMFLLGYIYLKRGNYEQSFELFKKASKSNYVEATFYCGSAYLNGFGVDINFEKSAHCFKEAADQENVPSMFIYATMAENGIGMNPNEKEAAKYYFKVAQMNVSGNVESMSRYSLLCSKGIAEDKEKAFKWNEKVKNNYYYFQIMKGEGQGDINDAKSKLEDKSKENANVSYLLGCCYEEGFSCEKDMKKAIDIFKDAALKGDEDAMIKIVELEEKGLIHESSSFYDKMYNPYVMYIIAKKLIEKNDKKENEKGLILLKKAAEDYQPNAMIEYGKHILFSSLKNDELCKGLLLLRKAAEMIPLNANNNSFISFDNAWDSVRYSASLYLNMHIDYGGNDGCTNVMDWITIIGDMLINALEQNIDEIQFVPGKGVGTSLEKFSPSKQIVILVCLRLGFDCYVEVANNGIIICKINTYHKLKDEYLDAIIDSNDINNKNNAINNTAYMTIKEKYPTMPNRCIEIIVSSRNYDVAKSIDFANQFENKLQIKKYEQRMQQFRRSNEANQLQQVDIRDQKIASLRQMVGYNVIHSTHKNRPKFAPIINLDLRDVPKREAETSIIETIVEVKTEQNWRIHLLLPLDSQHNDIENMKAFLENQAQINNIKKTHLYVNVIKYLNMTQIEFAIDNT
ncbi:hypothetical protein M9Y10_014539 [Tritrichomonas musculus]|uniref:Sel1 repeat protein n=1 Tax=Tritrichomonas musculus TaxID=1915356 RepID=A0ABR2L1P5_9EUKA